MKHCPKCGYTKADAAQHGDHHLCDGAIPREGDEMTQFYIGAKQITAWPQDRDGAPGYAVKYSDGYTSWSPKEPFESAYLPMGEGNDGSKITEEMVEAFLGDTPDGQRMGNHAVFVFKLANGFDLVESAACVDPKNFDMAIGAKYARERAKSRAWHLLGFLLAHARNGLK